MTNASGMVMMPPGTALTAALLSRLANLGVETVVVVDDASLTQRSPEDVQRTFDARFAGHEQDPWMMDLKAIVLRQALRGGDDA